MGLKQKNIINKLNKEFIKLIDKIKEVLKYMR